MYISCLKTSQHTGYRHQGFYGKSAFMSSRRASMNEILQRVQKVEDLEAEVRRLVGWLC